MKPLFEEHFDIEAMIVSLYVKNKQLMCDFFETIGAPELKFIEKCAVAMGLGLGVFQLCCVLRAIFMTRVSG